jgi:nitronate monooxygenase
LALASGGLLAAEWSRAGGLGLIGAAYGDLEWTRQEHGRAIEALRDQPEALARLGCGFITWKLEEDCSALDWLLDQPQLPAAVMLSFGRPGPWAKRLLDRGVAVVCQIQRIEQLPEVVDSGATVVVAQGCEAGGHGMKSSLGRSTFTLVPEIADRLSAMAPETLLVAAGGVADGRGLAAALILGADGAMIGSRAWATEESLANGRAKAVALDSSGDETMRSQVFDILRSKNWPEPYDFRALRNTLHREWEGREEELRAEPALPRQQYNEAVLNEDFSRAHIAVGETVGLLRDIPPAGDLLRRITREAMARMAPDRKS